MPWNQLPSGGLTAIFAFLPLTACVRPPAEPATVRVHVGASAPHVTLYQLDPSKPWGERIQPICEAPCERSVEVAGRLFFFEGETAPKSLHFEIGPRSPDVTIVAHAGSRSLRNWGIATTVLGAITMPAGVVTGALVAWGDGSGSSRGMVAGLAVAFIGFAATLAGTGMISEAKTGFDLRDGAPSFRAGRLRLDGGGLAVGF